MKDISEYLNKYYPRFDESLKGLIIKHGVLKFYESGEQIMRTGQFFKSTMLVAQGRIKVYREGEDGNEFFMYYLEPGSACALSMICAAKNESSQIMARAIEDTYVIALPIELMDDLMRNHKSWYYFVLETYRLRFDEILNLLDNIAFKSMDERLLFYLNNQAQVLGSNEINTTHQEIANDLNSSREVISRLLKKMELNGLVKLDRNQIILLNKK
ncbi:MAG TPA: Crp/Fnr family transcriptional regulator [Cyclobacteriaceae bacterium]|nr:Crp/Fnr family transcriptional regulator [Cyclobacteriaceae bacterium]